MEKTKFILVEGLDGMGKTTYINGLKKRFESKGKKVHVYHNTSSDERTIEWYKHLFSEQDMMMNGEVVIWDRGFIGPFVWPFFFKGQEFTITNPQRVIKELIEPFDIQLVLPVAQTDADFAEIARRRPEEYTPEFKSIQHLFNGMAHLLFKRPLKHYGFFDDEDKNKNKQEERIWKWLNK